MKSIITIALFLFASVSYGQTIDTTVRSIAACKVVPFKANYTDTSLTTHVGVRIITDNLKDECVLYWMLLDASGNKTGEGNASIKGTDYTNWNGSNLYPFIFIGTKYKLTFK